MSSAFAPLRVRDRIFQCSRPYSAGHELSELEAEVLNNLRAENIRNIFVRKLNQGQTEAQLREAFAALDRQYHFSLRSTEPVDPIALEAREQARILAQALHKPFEEVLRNPELWARARRAVEERRKLAQSLIGKLGT